MASGLTPTQHFPAPRKETSMPHFEKVSMTAPKQACRAYPTGMAVLALESYRR